MQEGLTNTLKHAAAAQVTVVIRYLPGSLEVTVTDDGQGTSGAGQDGTGHGLVGMRERVLLYGGELQSGPLPESGYQLVARLPVEHNQENGDDLAARLPAAT